MWTSWRALTLLAVLALTCAAARGDDALPGPRGDPDAKFLEFLGSVDRLAEVNPDYLRQVNSATAPKPQGKAVAVPPPPSAPPRSALPPSASNTPAGATP